MLVSKDRPIDKMGTVPASNENLEFNHISSVATSDVYGEISRQTTTWQPDSHAPTAQHISSRTSVVRVPSHSKSTILEEVEAWRVFHQNPSIFAGWWLGKNPLKKIRLRQLG